MFRAWSLEVIVGVEEIVFRAVSSQAHSDGWVDSEALEERMVQALSSRKSFVRIECHHFFHKVDSLRRGIRDQLAKSGGHKFWESESDSRGKLVALWPLGIGGTSKHSTSFVNLISLVIPWEQRSHHV